MAPERLEKPEREEKIERETTTLPAKMPLFSPAGYIVLVFILVIEGILVYTLSNFLNKPAESDQKQVKDITDIAKVDLGEIKANFTVSGPGGNNVESKRILIKPVLFLDEKVEDVAKVISYAINIKAKLKHRVRELMEQKSYQTLRQASGQSDLAFEIRDKLNQELKGTIKDVSFDEFEFLD